MKPSVLACSSPLPPSLPPPPLSRCLIIYCHPATWLCAASKHRRHSWRRVRRAGSHSHSRPSMASRPERRSSLSSAPLPFRAGVLTQRTGHLAQVVQHGSSQGSVAGVVQEAAHVRSCKCGKVSETGSINTCGDRRPLSLRSWSVLLVWKMSLCISAQTFCQPHHTANQFALFSSPQNVTMNKLRNREYNWRFGLLIRPHTQ